MRGFLDRVQQGDDRRLAHFLVVGGPLALRLFPSLMSGTVVFNGFLYTARAHEADLRSQAVRDRLSDLRNRISRDVRTSWLSANNAYQRLAVTQQLLEQAQLSLELAQARYKLGLGSIVELSQAQLQATQAEISNAQAGYDYRLANAVLRYETTGL